VFEALTAAQLLLPNPRVIRTEEKPHRQGEESTRQPNEEENGQGVSPKIEHYTVGKILLIQSSLPIPTCSGVPRQRNGEQRSSQEELRRRLRHPLSRVGASPRKKEKIENFSLLCLYFYFFYFFYFFKISLLHT